MTFRRILGVMVLLIAIVGLASMVGGTISAHRAIDNIGSNLETNLTLALQNLDTAETTLRSAKTTVDQVQDRLDTVDSAAADASQTLSETEPLLDQLAQMAMPDMTQAATVIENTLAKLSTLHVDKEILGVPIRFDLSMDDIPEAPLETLVDQIGDSLAKIPANVLSSDGYIGVKDEDLAILRQTIRDDLEVIKGGIAEAEPLLDHYICAVAETSDAIRQTQADLSRDLRTAKLGVTTLIVWIGLMLFVPLLYLGWGWTTGQRGLR